MPTHPAGPSARELAAAVHRGLAGHAWPLEPPTLPAPPAAPPIFDVAPRLAPLASSIGLAVGGGGFGLLRRLFRVLLRPWLDVQTRFNQELINTLHTVQEHFQTQLAALHDELAKERGRVRRLTARLNDVSDGSARGDARVAELATRLGDRHASDD